MRKQLYVLLLVLLTTVLFAQAPEWQWATQAGGSEGDLANGISTDADGNVYVTGFFEATASFGSFNLTSSGFLDIFVAKLDSNGNWLWAEKAGGSEGDLANGISTDADGNVYVTGYFEATASFGSFNLTSSGSDDIFIAKLDSNGNWLWAEKAGGSEGDYGKGIITDADGNVYVTGYFRGIASFGSFNLTSSGSKDIFVAKMDSNGNWLWAEKAGGIIHDEGRGISTDADGNVYVIGGFYATASFGSYNLTGSGFWDIFVAKLNSSVFVENEINPAVNSLSNYPNPFNPTTTISFSIPKDSKVELSIYNIKGQKVKQLISEQFSTGQHSVVWDGRDDNNLPVGSGIYFYTLKINGNSKAINKMILIK